MVHGTQDATDATTASGRLLDDAKRRPMTRRTHDADDTGGQGDRASADGRTEPRDAERAGLADASSGRSSRGFRKATAGASAVAGGVDAASPGELRFDLWGGENGTNTLYLDGGRFE